MGDVERSEGTENVPDSAVSSPATAESLAVDSEGRAVATSDTGVEKTGEEDQVGAADNHLSGLVVLPPLQGGDAKPDTTRPLPVVKLPLIRSEEPVQSIRAALAEVVGLAHITNYRLELLAEGPQGETVAWNPDANDPVSAFTGKHAVVSTPVSYRSLEERTGGTTELLGLLTGNGGTEEESKMVLDDWGDLSALEKHGLTHGSAFQIILQRYDLGTIKEHVMRLRTLLHGGAPSVVSLVESPEEPENPDEVEQDATSKQPSTSPSALPDVDSPVDGKNLKDFFYLASGEDPAVYKGSRQGVEASQKSPKRKKKPKSTGAQGAENGGNGASKPTVSVEQETQESLPKLNELEELCNVGYDIEWSGFHPPPSTRKIVGDIAYFELMDRKADSPVLFVTACRTGFFVNRCKGRAGSGRTPYFDPSPAVEHCFSHTLLDCLLKASNAFRSSWSKSLQASRQRAEILQNLNQSSPFQSLFRVAIRTDFPGFKDATSAAAAVRTLDATLQAPSWLVPVPRKEIYCQNVDEQGGSSVTYWNRNYQHGYDKARVEDELANSFGIEVKNGGIRDWNEEVQIAREMPANTLTERVDRARLLHKVMSDFAEASLLGVKAIAEGQVTPMNPNEPMRTQVFLHNNIFFSRAADAGPDTFKLAIGDRAARKAANRELQCNSIFYRMEKLGLYTLANVLIDYLGSRYVCQSVLPGVLVGEQAHTLLMGTVESLRPLKWDKTLHKTMEEKVGESMMVASRPVFRYPLTAERTEEIKKVREALPEFDRLLLEKKAASDMIADPKMATDPNAVMMTCMPIEAKAIRGSDQRDYLLDFSRLTPRDANWIPQEKGGTGKWEEARKESSGKTSTAVPSSLNDHEWTMSVLRPELVTRFTQVSISKYIREKRAKDLEKKADQDAAKGESESPAEGDVTEGGEDVKEKTEGKASDAKDAEALLNEESAEELKRMRLNINVFLPDMKSFRGVNEEVAVQIERDEERVREASSFLWDEVLPKVTNAVREGSIHQLPVDGKSLTEFIHRNGINCRYLGRLAVLAKREEDRDSATAEDLRQGRLTRIERRTMPKCWLELLECEIVARAAKHVLDSYLMEHAAVAASEPGQTIASFFSAVLSESEETAAQTETRLEKRGTDEPDEDDFGALTLSGVGAEGDAVISQIRSRYEVWQDIQLEIGRRFRYTLTLFNNGKSPRARYVPLLRRLCERTGVRLQAKTYDVGGKCLCGNAYGGTLIGSYPISPVDIIDVLPLMKHAAAYNEGFYPCSLSPVTIPPLQVSLQDARAALERAHIQTSSRALNRGLELAQEALSLYQRVTESPVHPGVVESMELMAAIFHEGTDYGIAAFHGEKALSLAVQVGGFDSSVVLNSHLTLSQMFMSAGDAVKCAKHLRAAIYLLETMAGPNHTEIYSAYQKLGAAYSASDLNGRYLSMALKYFQEASNRDSCDRLMEGLASKNMAKIYAAMGEYKDALESEKKAFRILSMFLGREHQITKSSDESLKEYTKLAVEKGNRSVEMGKLEAEAAKAEAFAADLMAAELEEKSNKSKKKKKKGKK